MSPKPGVTLRGKKPRGKQERKGEQQGFVERQQKRRTEKEIKVSKKKFKRKPARLP